VFAKAAKPMATAAVAATAPSANRCFPDSNPPSMPPGRDDEA